MSRDDRYLQMIGASKSLMVSIGMFRQALGRRGPWKGGSLRDYHDELLVELVTAKRSKIRLSELRARQGEVSRGRIMVCRSGVGRI